MDIVVMLYVLFCYVFMFALLNPHAPQGKPSGCGVVVAAFLAPITVPFILIAGLYSRYYN